MVRLLTLLRLAPVAARAMFHCFHSGERRGGRAVVEEHLGVVDLHIHRGRAIARLAAEEQHQRRDAVLGPVLGGREGALGLGEGGPGGVLIGQGHRLLAAVDDRLLGEGGLAVADDRAVGGIVPAVDPGLVDGPPSPCRPCSFRSHRPRRNSAVEKLQTSLSQAGGLGVVDLDDLPEVGLVQQRARSHTRARRPSRRERCRRPPPADRRSERPCARRPRVRLASSECTCGLTSVAPAAGSGSRAVTGT